MTGRTPTTVSPSSCRMSRKTPCVLGCCGPMLRVSSLASSGDWTSSTAAPSNTSEALHAAGRRALPLGAVAQVADQDPLVVERPVLAQWVAGEVLVGQDPPQVGVASELDAHQVVDLSLLELRARPDGRERRAERIRLAGQVDSQHEALAMGREVI